MNNHKPMIKKKKKSSGRGGHTRRKHYREMCEDEGEFCKVCFQAPPDVYLEIHHKDNNPKNDARANREFRCRSDNRKGDGRGKGRRKGLDSSVVDQPKAGSAEFEKNKIAFPKYAHWLNGMVTKHGRIPLTDAINSGAFVANVSTVTIKRYLLSLCSNAGPYMIEPDGTLDAKVIVFRSAGSVGIPAETEDDL